MKNKSILLAFFILVLGIVFYWQFLSAPGSGESERFIVPLHTGTQVVAEKLKDEGFIRNTIGFDVALYLRGNISIEPGGYKISKGMNAWEVISVLRGSPYMKWVTIPEGLRKEEIADILSETLEWSENQKDGWIQKDTTKNPDFFEGVYFPDTYLIPKDETPEKVAERMQNKFQEKFAEFAKEATQQNIKWTTLLKIASIVQREAAGRSDMPLIAGILWNRLLQDTKLEIDATVQYIRGNTEKGWWAPIKVSDKQIDSKYNTYKYKGLPPHPISNPGITAIRAVLFPEETKCLFYLHDNSGQIHCAKTYDEHKVNIEKYLR
ncbi:MAG: endolytic transglycosylase MltG [Patescibacteria group bacterium]